MIGEHQRARIVDRLWDEWPRLFGDAAAAEGFRPLWVDGTDELVVSVLCVDDPAVIGAVTSRNTVIREAAQVVAGVPIVDVVRHCWDRTEFDRRLAVAAGERDRRLGDQRRRVQLLPDH